MTQPRVIHRPENQRCLGRLARSESVATGACERLVRLQTSMTAAQIQPPHRYSRRLEALLTIVGIELLAVVLLLLLSDSGIVLQFSLPVAAGVMLLNWRRLWRAYKSFSASLRRLALSLKSCL